MALAAEEDAILRLERRPGQYVIRGSPLVTRVARRPRHRRARGRR